MEDTATVSTAIEQIVVNMNAFATGIVTQIGSYTTAIASNDILMSFLGIAFATIGIGVIIRILHRIG